MPILLASAGGVTTLVSIELLLRVLLGLIRDVWVPERAAIRQIAFFVLADEAYALYPRITFSGSRPSLGSRLRLRDRGMGCVCLMV